MNLFCYFRKTMLIFLICGSIMKLVEGSDRGVHKVNTDLIIGGFINTDDDILAIRGSALVAKKFNETYWKSLAESHICSREELYVEVVKVPSMQPVRVRTLKWCMEIPPRCSLYKTEYREVIKMETINKTRTIRFCCEGYEGTISAYANDSVCKPICRGGCGRGSCVSPDVCRCETGYTGKHCTNRCDHDRWGLNCKNHCLCRNGSTCDNKSGICHCTSGWTGEYCEIPCPSGKYGVMCRNLCKCGEFSSHRCHPQTGACETDVFYNTTTGMLRSLNYTFINITNNLDRIAKNIEQITTTTQRFEEYTFVREHHIITTPPSIAHDAIAFKETKKPLQSKISVQQAAIGLPADVIQVIASNERESRLNVGIIDRPPNVKKDDFVALEEKVTIVEPKSDIQILMICLVVLFLILVVIGVVFLWFYRYFSKQKRRVEVALVARPANVNSMTGARNVETSNVGQSSNDLPSFAQVFRNKFEDQKFCDTTPSKRFCCEATPYNYMRREPLQSVVGPKILKSSNLSHLYDAVGYDSEQKKQKQIQLQQLHQHLQQKLQQRHYQHESQQESQQCNQQSAPLPLKPKVHTGRTYNAFYLSRPTTYSNAHQLKTFSTPTLTSKPNPNPNP